MEEQCFVDLYTTEGEHLSGQPWQCYPRPQLRRDSFINLNGPWEFTVAEGEALPEVYPETIRVPFPPESLLSGVHRAMPEGRWLCYRRRVSLTEPLKGKRVLLHIGAADQVAEVYVNGVCVGRHEGGYEAFSVDITDAVAAENVLVIRVKDCMSELVFPYGKQSAKRGGMWYTPVSGIWQTVWMEVVPEKYIRRLHIRTWEKGAEIRAEGGSGEGTVLLQLPKGELCVPMTDGRAEITLDNPMLWSPERPYLYHFSVCCGEDQVESYFALRTLEIKEIRGFKRLCLNGKPYFFHGVLDQGYWSDGLFTPASPACYEKDILAMKSLGFNMLRKHVKVEPELYYYTCDRLGMVVFQDLVNNGDYHFIRDTALPNIGFKKKADTKIHRDKKMREQFLRSMEQTVRQLGNHPCICYWTIFNEGWGQFQSTKCYQKMKGLDPTRFIATVSGWFKGGESDVAAEHTYFRPFRPCRSERPLVLSEFGGYTFRPEGHTFNPEKEYGYRHFERQEEYEKALVALYEREILPALEQGLCGAVYTQLSDVEDEINGLLSYDRKVLKVSGGPMQELAWKLKRSLEGQE